MVEVIPGPAHPAPPPNTGTSPLFVYPEAADATIRKIAEYIGAGGIIALLDHLRVFVLGDLGKAMSLAEQFSRETKLTQAVDAINDAQLSLAGAWQGDGYAQFSEYAGMATSRLSKGQDEIIKLAATMTSVAKDVLDTYKTLITLIGNCAANLSQLGGKIAIAVASLPIPILDAIEAKDVIDTINTAFATFWRDCNSALGSTITNIGNLVGSGLDFTVIQTNFPPLLAVGSSTEVIGNPKRWTIKPGADDS
ncbi:MAG: hypothetical protein JWQ81_5254 [Amycolatopsis sp.]|uniref:hypothetical protein n=1 Tax=Amycolatopsis sp. TaxID=37632 RepID=UPI0026176C68|nr:hypothetical protein [Amycolatopsis sp.]MCU1684515.1 hypothetical protein [Amycolatopsis sp.]